MFFYFKENKDRKLREGARETSFDWLSKYQLALEFRFHAMLCSNKGNENSDADHVKWSRRPHVAPEPQVSCPWSEAMIRTSLE